MLEDYILDANMLNVRTSEDLSKGIVTAFTRPHLTRAMVLEIHDD